MPHAMSRRGGNNVKGPPAHQNKYAFKHNKHSKKSKMVMAVQLENLCRRCTDQLEWRKKYRKYKLRTVLGRCNHCQKKNVKAAYHTLCPQCVEDLEVCSKCTMPRSDPDYGNNNSGGGMDLDLPEDHPLQVALTELGMTPDDLLEGLERGTLGLRERERRSLLRQLLAAMQGTGQEAEHEQGAESEHGVEGDATETEGAQPAAAAAAAGSDQ